MSPEDLYTSLKQAPLPLEALNLSFCQDPLLSYEYLKACGFPIAYTHQLELSTNVPYQDSLYCFIDIETNGSDPKTSQVIEIAALLYKPAKDPFISGMVVKSFSSLIYCEHVPPKIAELTGLSAQHLRHAPPLKQVLKKFREFLGDSVFVAHNADFDFPYLSECCAHNLGAGLLNPKLCTLSLSRKSILSPKHGLGFLNTFLGINIPTAHRAAADALGSLKVFEVCLRCLPAYVCTTQDLLDYA
ncbi:DEDDh 3'-5' exonuclease domain of the epsilon subunit of DNA polymerase III [Helicobacter heilmannii]|uniref:DEDDh 3'-5' exonuclease domain of the epsilon subunit of DNA polymerase III n=1 Tax=Helicobacter heilmannii TaxID=35817 RepID=A0A0K2XVE2_HELHE|nr:exonuclease domain-containing protein [Helicobacter heilmannii]CCM11705.1 DNA polymerase III subunit epsilon [Helicobacter heilmannii ASB1.4]CRF45610.1 DEDDh 3'-5' exonuclease domain of the epsilon subunit of DNA polymerase III [Helicobacter heilmannii]CRF47085.1 DEDDh 3'-5' exonuclease domain of the epsilon subunit of DNA polymerase III [Helicobacter heilmannii]CRF48975.1 DEDDh 3'-5' exonuclease domain of the epsilon subunit of DNA polymerase III [Helicobacter heilmannii]CRF50593.1 DEDDh 3